MKLTIKTPKGFEFSAENNSDVGYQYLLSALEKLVEKISPEYAIWKNRE